MMIQREASSTCAPLPMSQHSTINECQEDPSINPLTESMNPKTVDKRQTERKEEMHVYACTKTHL